MTKKGAVSAIFVLDALDKCNYKELVELIGRFKHQFRKLKSSKNRRIKFFLTSRPCKQIMVDFRELLDDFPSIYIPGEESFEQISREVNRMIEYRVDNLAKDQKLKADAKEALA